MHLWASHLRTAGDSNLAWTNHHAAITLKVDTSPYDEESWLSPAVPVFLRGHVPIYSGGKYAWTAHEHTDRIGHCIPQRISTNPARCNRVYNSSRVRIWRLCRSTLQTSKAIFEACQLSKLITLLNIVK